MKNSRNKATHHFKFGIFFLGISLFLLSCEKDTEIFTEPTVPKYTLTHKKFDSFTNNNSLLKKVNSFSKSKNKATSKENNIVTDDFIIFADRVTYLRRLKDSSESYSFYIERNSKNELNKIENLILTKDLNSNEYKSYIATYFFPNGINDKKENFEILDFKEINNQNVFSKSIGMSSRSSGCGYEVTEIEHNCYSGEHSGAGDAGNCDGNGSLPYSTWVLTLNDCGSGGGPGGGGGPVNPNDHNNLPGGGGSNNNGSGGSGPVDTGISLPPSCQSNDCDEVIVANQINDLLGNTLNYQQLIWLNENDIQANNIKRFLDNNPNSVEVKNFAKEAVIALMNNGEIDLDNRLIYNPVIGQDYKASMSAAEIAIFDTLDEAIQILYLTAAAQAYTYVETHFPQPVRNTKGDAFKHTYWNALSTVYIGEILTEQLTTAHEDIQYDPNYLNHFKETQMDYHNNAQGRQIAYGSGKLHQLVQNALNNGDLRYLNNLIFQNGFWNATDNSNLTPTNQ